MISLGRAGRFVTQLAGQASYRLRVHDVFKTRVASSIPAVSKATGLTPPAVSSAIEALVTLDIVREVTARQRNRQFLYVGYLKTLENGTS